MSTSQKTHFIHRIDYSTRERLVGIFVLVGIALLLAQLFISGQALQLFAPKRTYVIQLKNPVGVSADTKVRVSGLEVGWVDNVTLTERNTFLITLAVYEKFHALVRQDSRASISKLALVGDSVINITPGSIQKPALKNGDFLIAEEGMSVEDLMAKVQPVLDQAQESANHVVNFLKALPVDAMKDMVNDLKTTTHNLAKISTNMQNTDSLVGDAMFGNQLNDQVNTTIKSTQETLTQTQSAIAEASKVIQQLPAVIDATNVLIDKLNKQAEQIPPLVDSTNELIDGSLDVLDSVSNTWPISSNMPETTTPQEPLNAMPAN